MNGEQLKEALRLLGMTLTDLSDLMEINVKTVSLWANNHAPVRKSVALYLELRVYNLQLADMLRAARPSSSA